MLTIIGAAGNVGSSTVSALRKAGGPVRAILHSPKESKPLEASGCEVVVADLQQPTLLAGAIAGSEVVQIVVPLRPATPDPVEDMHATVDSLIQALTVAQVPRVLVISDYGAHVEGDIGMPTIFRNLESHIVQLQGKKIILRSAEHMHNLARGISAAINSGTFATFQRSVDQLQPMIAAQDLGKIAADLILRDQTSNLEIVHAEGPCRYSAEDSAAALSELSGRAIKAQAVPRQAWREALERNMPPPLAGLMMRTNDAKDEGGLVDVQKNVGETITGTTKLMDALRPLMPR